MKIFDVSIAECQEIAQSIGIRFEGSDESNSKGFRVSGRLFPQYGQPRDERPYGRISTSGWLSEGLRQRDGRPRGVAAVCWHGHRDFMAELFKRHPDARIKTMWADYRGAQEFQNNHAETGFTNVGSMMYPMQACEACECKESGQANPAIIPGTSYSVTMRHSDIRACPHVIFNPEHYRPDGSCKCNDPNEQERMIREDGYSREDFVTV